MLLQDLKGRNDVIRFCVLVAIENNGPSNIVSAYNYYISTLSKKKKAAFISSRYSKKKETTFISSFYSILTTIQQGASNLDYAYFDNYGNSIMKVLIDFHKNLDPKLRDNVHAEKIFNNYQHVITEKSKQTIPKQNILLLFHMLSIFGILPPACYRYSEYDANRGYNQLLKKAFPTVHDYQDKFEEIYHQLTHKDIFGICQNTLSRTKFEHILHCIGIILEKKSDLDLDELLSNSEELLHTIWKDSKSDWSTVLEPEIHYLDQVNHSLCNLFEFTTKNSLCIRCSNSIDSTYVTIVYSPDGDIKIKECNKGKAPKKEKLQQLRKICLSNMDMDGHHPVELSNMDIDGHHPVEL